MEKQIQVVEVHAFANYIILYYCSLVIFRKVLFTNEIHRKLGNCGVKRRQGTEVYFS